MSFAVAAEAYDRFMSVYHFRTSRAAPQAESSAHPTSCRTQVLPSGSASSAKEA